MEGDGSTLHETVYFRSKRPVARKGLIEKRRSDTNYDMTRHV